MQGAVDFTFFTPQLCISHALWLYILATAHVTSNGSLRYVFDTDDSTWKQLQSTGGRPQLAPSRVVATSCHAETGAVFPALLAAVDAEAVERC